MTTSTRDHAELSLGLADFGFADLHRADRLRDLYERFCDEVQRNDPVLWAEWDAYRLAPDAPQKPVEVSSLLVRMAPHVSRFLARLFGIEAETSAVRDLTRADDELFRFKVEFVRRRALPLVKSSASQTAGQADEALVEALIAAEGLEDRECALARAGCRLLDLERALEDGPSGGDQAAVAAKIQALGRWIAGHLHDPAYHSWVVFRLPAALDYFNLVPCERREPDFAEALTGPEARLRLRDGFTLTDHRMDGREVLGEIHYCVLCHERDKDSCSKGMRTKDGSIARNPLDISLEGCPLDEKISEMHMVRKSGDAIGALALVAIDNPVCAGTGHRICNDCMKACIFQKQDPVNIPEIETGILTDVLRMPWGVEIYGLLTRWNPLNVRRPFALPYNGKNVLVVGLGPAGYTLAHYLLNEGFGVVGIDALKIEPLPRERVGGNGGPPEAIRHWDTICRALDDRVLEGFGGVSEYGITVRWDKNFLTLLHLTLARRDRFAVHGGVRFGGTMTLEDAWALGFDHVAIAAGAGRPTIIDMKNNLIRGIRKASDFLMALQLTGAFKRMALANLQVQLPAVVIGGGLTAVDTATELLAYYPLQVEKILARYEAVVPEIGEAQLRARFDVEELSQLDEFVAHGRLIREERTRARAAGEQPNFLTLVRRWGGVSMVYRKRLVDSPAYRLNHEEIIKALEEGVRIVENLNPVEAVPDEFQHVKALRFGTAGGEQVIELRARSVFVAAGTSPNVTYERELPGTFQLDSRGKFYEPHVVVRDPHGAFRLERSPHGLFTSYEHDGHFVTFYGDNHPSYAGNVVKAMASAKAGYPEVVRLFADDLATLDPARQSDRDHAWHALRSRLDDELMARVQEVVRLTPTIVEVVVRAPAAARHFRPGQFYRLQNFERTAPAVLDRGSAGDSRDRGDLIPSEAAFRSSFENPVLSKPPFPFTLREPQGERWGLPVEGLRTNGEVTRVEGLRTNGEVTRVEGLKTNGMAVVRERDEAVIGLVMEGLALTGAWVDPERGLLSMIALELGVSSRLCAYLRPGDEVIVMGPTGTPTEIPAGEKVLLAGGGLGNAVLFSIAAALRERGNRVLYFAGYRRGEDLFKREAIESATDQVVWSTDEGAPIAPHRPQDRHFRGNIVDAMVSYAQGQLGEMLVPLRGVDRIIAIGSDRMMAAVKNARSAALSPYLKREHVAIASINSPMQCMMKEVCAQCLQKQIDPATGKETIVFTCFNQDQLMDRVDFFNLNARLRQNTVQEKLTNIWLGRLLEKSPLTHI